MRVRVWLTIALSLASVSVAEEPTATPLAVATTSVATEAKLERTRELLAARDSHNDATAAEGGSPKRGNFAEVVILFIGVVLLAAGLFRHFALRRGGVGPSRIVERIHLGPRAELWVVDVEGRRVLVGHGVSLLSWDAPVAKEPS